MDTSLPLPLPGADELAHLSRMQAHLAAGLRADGGRWPFSRYMHEALYAPGLGYYAAGARKFGRDGDFITAPEISPLFAGCLAHQVAEVFGALRRRSPGTPLTLVEYGAGSGVLAVQLLQSLAALHALPDTYAIVEVSADLRERQQAAIGTSLPAHLADLAVWWTGHAAHPWRGVVVANEVLDALPFERLRVGPDGLEQCFVEGPDGVDERPLCLRWLPATAAAAAAGATGAFGDWADWPEGTQFEWCPAIATWVPEALASLEAGVALYADYGLPRASLRGPHRPAGTCSAFFRHRQHEDVLLYPGLQDLTAWVDFTAVAEAGLAAGATVAGFTTQAQFLVNSGLEAVFAEALAAAENGGADGDGVRRRAAIAQGVQRLVLPQEMGERFRFLALAKGYDAELAGFARRDLTSTL